MDHAIEFFVAITALVFGLSHLLRPADWCDCFRQLHAWGRPGAFVNGAISLLPGAIVVTGHTSWDGPGAVITAFGWLLVLKGLICFLAPDKALRSMAYGSRTPRSFVAGGVVLLALAAWAGSCWGRAG